MKRLWIFFGIGSMLMLSACIVEAQQEGDTGVLSSAVESSAIESSSEMESSMSVALSESAPSSELDISCAESSSSSDSSDMMESSSIEYECPLVDVYEEECGKNKKSVEIWDENNCYLGSKCESSQAECIELPRHIMFCDRNTSFSKNVYDENGCYQTNECIPNPVCTEELDYVCAMDSIYLYIDTIVPLYEIRDNSCKAENYGKVIVDKSNCRALKCPLEVGLDTDCFTSNSPMTYDEWGCMSNFDCPVDEPVEYLDTTFSIVEATEVLIKPEWLSVRFDSIVSDSRCAPNMLCVWEGDAEISLTLSSDSGSGSITLHTSPMFTQDTTYFGYSVELVELEDLITIDQMDGIEIESNPRTLATIRVWNSID